MFKRARMGTVWNEVLGIMVRDSIIFKWHWVSTSTYCHFSNFQYDTFHCADDSNPSKFSSWIWKMSCRRYSSEFFHRTHTHSWNNTLWWAVQTDCSSRIFPGRDWKVKDSCLVRIFLKSCVHTALIHTDFQWGNRNWTRQ